jgi:hypothetical protein
MQRAVLSSSYPRMAKPGRGLGQAAFAGAIAIDTLPAAALPMNRSMTLLERFIAGSVSSLLALVLDAFSRATHKKRWPSIPERAWMFNY